MGYTIARHSLMAGAALICIAAAGPANAETKHFDIPAQSATTGIAALGRQADVEIVAARRDTQGKQTQAVRGDLSIDDALARLLDGTGLAVQHTGGQTYSVVTLGKAPAPSVASVAPNDADILVTGTRLKGVPVASPVRVITQKQMLDQGKTTVAAALRTLPQNFGGGQNSGVGLGTTGSFDDSGASTINLRGLGADATLTVLNGHRLPYNADFQSIDISNIPFDAVDRIEIVPDGASAIYGSDAVAGVVNIVLKPDYEGFETSARLGGSTDGGDLQQQYDVVTGSKWSSGGFIAVYDFERDLPIKGGDRSYAEDLAPGLYLTPKLKHQNVLISAHQNLTDAITFSVDGLYNKRWSRLDYALNASGDVMASGGSVRSEDQSFSIAPTLRAALPSGWEASLSGVYGKDRDHYAALNFADGQSIYPFFATYINRTEVIEVGGNGPLFQLPAGDVKLALGGGYRQNHYRENAYAIDESQRDYYGYAEANIPIVAAVQGVPAIDSLTANAAVRYEDYPGIDRVFSPKLGLVYAPTADFDLKGSWGKSFKIPTFEQRFIAPNVTAENATTVGGSAAAPSATALVLFGGNPDLKPERATSWSGTVDFHPTAIPALKLTASYFHVAYRDRVVSPITFRAQSLSNPLYADFVNTAPSQSEIAQAVALGQFENATGQPFDPTDVVAIVDDRRVNASSQVIHGIDFSGEYRLIWQNGQSLQLTASGAYLHSRQKLTDLQPDVDLAGRIFQPAHFRSQAGATWATPQVSVSAFVNYTGSVTDVRYSPASKISSMTTGDLTVQYESPRKSGPLANIALLLTCQNLTNAKPHVIQNTQVYEQPYDAANYSPVGRFVSFRITKKW